MPTLNTFRGGGAAQHAANRHSAASILYKNMNTEITVGSQWIGTLGEKIEVTSLESVPPHLNQERERGQWIAYTVLEGDGKGSGWHCRKESFLADFTPLPAPEMGSSSWDESEGTDNLTFVSSFKSLSCRAHANAIEKGWWKERDALLSLAYRHSGIMGQFAQTTLDAANLALIHSETSEALENVRHAYEPDDKIPEFSGVEAELADVLIRIMDFSAKRGFRIAEAVIAKMAMNKTRSEKHGGKTL